LKEQNVDDGGREPQEAKINGDREEQAESDPEPQEADANMNRRKPMQI
jgi:hypothetical protein